MAALRPWLGVFVGVAFGVVLWNLVALGVGIVRDFAAENDNAILVAGDQGMYERYEPYATIADVEVLMAWTAVAIAFLAVPNRHWLPSWSVRGSLQAFGAAATLALVFVLFLDRAEYSQGNRPYTLAWQIPVLVVAAAGTLVHAWLTRGASTADQDSPRS